MVKMRGISAAGAALAILASAGATVGPTRPQAEKPINWGNPVFQTTFNGARLDTARWSAYDDPSGKLSGWRRTLQSVRVRDGLLELIGHYQKPYGYVGGGLSYNFGRTYGRWVVRFRADRRAGYEPVVLLWPQDNNWPTEGEIDLAEIYSARRLGAGEFLHLDSHNDQTGNPIPPSVDFSKWHTLSVDWLPSHITFWLDGRSIWTVDRKPGGPNYIPSTPFHLAFQIDEGCSDHKCMPNASTPAQTRMQVAWVKIYAAPPGVTHSAADTAPGG